MVPAGPRNDPPRPAGIGRNHAAHRRLASAAKQRAHVRRLERQPLPFSGQHPVDLGQRRARPCHERQCAGLVERDAGQSRHGQRVAGGWPPNVAGVAADDAQGPFGGRHGLGQIAFGHWHHRLSRPSLGVT